MNIQEVISRLEAGNKNFVNDKLDGKLQNSSRRTDLTSGQEPYAIILMGGGDNGHNLNHLLSHITPALAASAEGAAVNDVVKKNAELTGLELKNRSSIISNAVESGKVKIIPAFYNLGSGAVDWL